MMHHGVGAAGQMAFLDARTKVSPQVVGHFDRGVGPRLLRSRDRLVVPVDTEHVPVLEETQGLRPVPEMVAGIVRFVVGPDKANAGNAGRRTLHDFEGLRAFATPGSTPCRYSLGETPNRERKARVNASGAL